jgi:hypothetical protein
MVRASFPALALSCGQRRSFHAWIFSSSRARACRLGFCGLQRIRRSSRQTSDGLTLRWKVSVISRPTRGKLHKSLS